MPQVTHKRNECIGCGLCPLAAPDYFHMDDDGLATLADAKVDGTLHRRQRIPKDDLKQLQQAAQDCPVDIIRVER